MLWCGVGGGRGHFLNGFLGSEIQLQLFFLGFSPELDFPSGQIGCLVYLSDSFSLQKEQIVYLLLFCFSHLLLLCFNHLLLFFPSLSCLRVPISPAGITGSSDGTQNAGTYAPRVLQVCSRCAPPHTLCEFTQIKICVNDTSLETCDRG